MYVFKTEVLLLYTRVCVRVCVRVFGLKQAMQVSQ